MFKKVLSAHKAYRFTGYRKIMNIPVEIRYVTLGHQIALGEYQQVMKDLEVMLERYPAPEDAEWGKLEVDFDFPEGKVSGYDLRYLKNPKIKYIVGAKVFSREELDKLE